jgi:hypothetical protein
MTGRGQSRPPYLDGRKGGKRGNLTRAQIRTVACPQCGAAAGEACDRAGELEGKQPGSKEWRRIARAAHHARMHLAQVERNAGLS